MHVIGRNFSSRWHGWGAMQGKQCFVKSFDLSFQNTTIFVLTYVFVLDKKYCFVVMRYSQSDIPREVCLAVSRNHKVFLLHIVGSCAKNPELILSYHVPND